MGYPERREREIQSRRASILACSRRLFAEKGFAGTTMEDLAAAAELTKVTIYKYFCSKQELLGTLLLANMKTLLGWFAEADAQHPEPVARLNAYGAIFVRFMQSEVPGSLGSYLLYLDLDSGELSDGLKAELRAHLALLFSRVRSLIDEGVERGVFRRDFDAARMSLVIWGATIGIQVLNAKLTPHVLPDFREDVFNEVLKLMPTGLLEANLPGRDHAR
jgi:AcrR family transcriptional regulator